MSRSSCTKSAMIGRPHPKRKSNFKPPPINGKSTLSKKRSNNM